MNGFANFVKTLGVGRIAMLAAILAGLAAFFIFIIFRLSAPGMAPLYGKLEANDAAAVVTKLESLKIPYELTGDGSVVMVPEDKVLRLRMTLAEDGLPSGGSAGYELFDKQDAFSATTFTQNLNYMRALEGELARTIRSLSTIEAARVHLVLPKHELFAQEKALPSASIVIRAKGGGLTRGQVKAIQNLVASAVEDLAPGRVSIVDEDGRLLASGTEGESPDEATTALVEERTNAYEGRLREQIEDIVARIVGPGRARVEVAAEMDFNRVTQSAEIYDPDSQVVRSSQTVEDKSADQEGKKNESVSIGNNLPDSQAPEGDGGTQSQSSKNRTEETINYEISKTTRTEILEAGRVKRLSVAVLVDGVTGAGAGGEKTYTPRSQEELDKIATLVRSAIGYDEKRGDQVTVVNLPFAAGEAPEPIADAAPLMGLEKGDYIRIGEIAALVIVSLLTILFVIRPLIKRLTGISQTTPALAAPVTQMLPDGTVVQVPAVAAPGQIAALPAAQAAAAAKGGAPHALAIPAIGAAPLSAMIDLAQVEGQVKESSVRKVGEIITKHPEESIAILRNWLYQSD